MKLTQEDINKLYQLKVARTHEDDIALILGIHVNTVRYWTRKLKEAGKVIPKKKRQSVINLSKIR